MSATDVSLELPAGKTLVVFEPNDVRKTTLLRMLATLLRAAGGGGPRARARIADENYGCAGARLARP